MTMTIRVLGTAIVCAALATSLAAQDTQFQLASAQVVMDGGGAATLKLAADGPVAVAVEPDGDAAPNRLRLRLYGVTPSPTLAGQSVSPFTIEATVDGRDTILRDCRHRRPARVATRAGPGVTVERTADRDALSRRAQTRQRHHS